MTNPNPPSISARTLITLATSQFVEAAAQQGGYILDTAEANSEREYGEQLWKLIKEHFAGNKPAEKTIAQIEADPLGSALNKLEARLDKALVQPDNQAFAQALYQLAQQLISPPPASQPRRPRTTPAEVQHHASVEQVLPDPPVAIAKLSPAEVEEIRQEAQELCQEGDADIKAVSSLPQKIQAARCRQAIRCYRQALALQEEIGDRSGMAATLDKMGQAYQRQTQYVLARDCFQQALEIYQALGERARATDVLDRQQAVLAAHHRHLHPNARWVADAD